MRLVKSKRGIELSMNVIVIAIIVILVLLIVAVFFTGGISSLIARLKGIVGTQTLGTSEAILKCQNFCQNYENTGSPINIDYQKNFCGETAGGKFEIDTNGDNKADRFGVTCIDLGVRCDAIKC